MHFHFHIHTGNEIQYDSQGAEFLDVNAARTFGLELIRNYFLIHPAPRPHIITKSVLYITDPDGNIEPVPFLDAFPSQDGSPVIHCSPGNA